MFGKDNKPLVVDAIHKAIESEKKAIEVFKKAIAKEIDSGKTVMAPLAHMTYFNLERESVEVQNTSSREMYQALNSVAINCNYDGVKDQCSGTVGDFVLSLSREKDSYGTYVVISAMPSMATIAQVANQVISDKKNAINIINTTEPDKSSPAPIEEIEVMKTESAVIEAVEDVIIGAEKFCTQCGTENVNDAKFCKSCGYSLIEQQPTPSSEQSEVHTEPAREQESTAKTEVEASLVENDVEVTSSWSGWLLLIPVLAWVLYRLGVLSGGNIGLMFGLMTIPNVVAEALGGAIAIVGVPLIVTGIIYGVKKANGIQYANLVKHTLIASILMLAFGIAGSINTIRDEQKAAAVQTTSEVVDATVPSPEPYILAEDAAAPVAEEYAAPAAAPAADYTEKVAAPAAEARQMTVEEACNAGDAVKCGQVGIMYHEGEGVNQSYPAAMKFFKKACDAGNANGCKNLGIMYAVGEGVEEDSNKAVRILKKACFAGSAGGCAALGNLYRWGGTNLEQDYPAAMKFLKKACDGGNADGCSDYEKLQSQGY